MLISDTLFVVVDTETTGLHAKTERLIELAAVKMYDGQVVDTFSRLINPRRRIPHNITRLTGISTSTVKDKKVVAEVLPEFLAFLEQGVFVAHNLSFDLQFINAEMERTGSGKLTNKTLCTLRLARRLMRGLPSKSLNSLIHFFKLSAENERRHRALPDAMAAAKILQRFIVQLDMQYGITTQKELLRFQFRTYRTIGQSPGYFQRLRETVLPCLPNTPGVYYFRDKKERILYIGKARNLKRRVRSYFSAIEAHTPRTRDLMRVVRDIQWIETTSDLEAILLESTLIKKNRPRFNQMECRYMHRPFVRITSERKIQRKAFPWNDGTAYYGPFRNCEQADCFVRAILLLFGHEMSEEQVAYVHAFLSGESDTLLYMLEGAMQKAAHTMHYEDAALYRDCLRQFHKRPVRAAPLFERNMAVVHHGTWQIILVRAGRPVAILDDERTLEEKARLYFEEEFAFSYHYREKEIDEVRLLAQWMYQNRNDVQVIPWNQDVNLNCFISDIMKILDMVGMVKDV